MIFSLTHICSALQEHSYRQSSNWTRISAVEKLLHDPVRAFIEGHNVRKKVLLCFPQVQDTLLSQHALQYLQWVQRSQNQKFCPHDKSLATRLEIWLKEKMGVSHYCETICKHKLTLRCLALPYNLNTPTGFLIHSTRALARAFVRICRSVSPVDQLFFETMNSGDTCFDSHGISITDLLLVYPPPLTSCLHFGLTTF